MYNGIFWLIVVFLSVEFLVSQVLAWMNRKAASSPIPPEVEGLYDEQEYVRQQNYFKTNNRFSLYVEGFNFLLMSALLIWGVLGWLCGYLSDYTESETLLTLCFFGVLFVANEIITLPFSVYSVFVIEERFGFNKTTPATFVADKLKGLLLGVVIGGGLLFVITWLYGWLQSSFWLAAFAVVALFSVLLNMFYSTWIVPLFNKQEPLPEGELRSAIEAFSDKAGFKLDNIYVIDGSKRSSKANAYFSGLGRKKRIVLYDTLIDELSTDEIVAVLAHEIGHYQHHHTRQMMWASLLNTFILFYLFSLLCESPLPSEALGGTTASFPLSLVAFSMLYTPVGMLTGILSNYVSRKNEYQADAFAVSCGYGEALIGALKKISANALCNLTPAKSFVFVYYSHPTLVQRIDNIKKQMR